jgi:hypothetical protein
LADTDNFPRLEKFERGKLLFSGLVAEGFHYRRQDYGSTHFGGIYTETFLRALDAPLFRRNPFIREANRQFTS